MTRWRNEGAASGEKLRRALTRRTGGRTADHVRRIDDRLQDVGGDSVEPVKVGESLTGFVFLFEGKLRSLSKRL